MQIYYYHDFGKHRQSQHLLATLEVINQLLSDHEIIPNLNKADFALFTGSSSAVFRRIKRAKQMRVKTLFFLPHHPTLDINDQFFFFNRRYLKNAKLADWIIVTAFADKEMLLEAGYAHVFFLPELITKNWFTPNPDDTEIFLRSAGITPKAKFVLNVGSVVNELAQLTNYINLCYEYKDLKFVYINFSEHEAPAQLALDLPENFIYLPFLSPDFIAAAAHQASLILLTANNRPRSPIAFNLLAVKHPVILAENGCRYEPFIHNQNVIRGINTSDYSIAITNFLTQSLPPLRDEIARLYHINVGRSRLNQLFQELKDETVS